MTGSMQQLGTDRWELRVDIARDPTTGGRRTRSRTVRVADRSAAQAALQAFVVDLGVAPGVPATVGELVEIWYHHSRDRRSPAWDERVRLMLDRHVLPGVGALGLGSVTVVDLESFLHGMGRSLSPQTVRHAHHVLRPAFRLAVRFGWLATSPADAVELPPMQRAEIEPPAMDAVLHLIGQADDDLADFAHLALATGARAGELAALRWIDVDLERGTVTIAGSISVARGELIRKRPKSRRGLRRLSIDAGTVDRLVARRVRMGSPPRMASVFPATQVDDRIPVRPSTWSARWHRLCERHGEHIRFHDLRHLHASCLLDAGVGVDRVAARLGHARTSTTQDVYGHLMRPNDRDLSDVFEHARRVSETDGAA